MDWRGNRLNRLLNRRAYGREVGEFFAEQLMSPKVDPAVADRCRKRLDELDDEATYLEGAILRIRKFMPGG